MLNRIAPDFVGSNPGLGYSLSVSLYEIVLGVFMLLLQYGVMERTRLDRYVDTMQELLHQQHWQYESSKENAE